MVAVGAGRWSQGEKGQFPPLCDVITCGTYGSRTSEGAACLQPFPYVRVGGGCHQRGDLLFRNHTEELLVCCRRVFSQNEVASERCQVCLAGSVAGSRGSENGKGVWSEAGCQQGIDGLSRNAIS